MLFDVSILFQKARMHEQSGTKQSNLIRSSIRAIRQSLISGHTDQTADAKQPMSEVSRSLALAMLSEDDDDESFYPGGVKPRL